MVQHQDTNILINSLDTAIEELHLQTIINTEIPDHSIEIITMNRTGVYTPSEPYVYEVQINEILVTQNPQFIMILTIHLKK